MKLLLTIPHYFHPTRGGELHGSSRNAPGPRVAALGRSIRRIHELFGEAQSWAHLDRPGRSPANAHVAGQVDVVVCTTAGRHLLNDLDLPEGAYQHQAARCNPTMLGFECQVVLRDAAGDYDYYGFLEDDLVLHDPWFFNKLGWFEHRAGVDSLLLPNRYETTASPTVEKVYIDGDLAARFTAAFRDTPAFGEPARQPQWALPFLNSAVLLRRPSNPHSGCYFLSAEQFDHWRNQAHFLNRDTRFVGPLESAATLGLIKSFRIYKPAPRSANFLDIEHAGGHWIERFRLRDSQADAIGRSRHPSHAARV